MTLGTVPGTVITCDEYAYDMDDDCKEEAERNREGGKLESTIYLADTRTPRGDSGTCGIRDTY